VPQALLDKLGIQLDPELLVLALTHRSFAHEAGGIPTNERLEFLGDAVLGLVVTETLYASHPDAPEGELAKMRAATVSQKALAGVARELELGQYILLGRGEKRTRGFDKDSILSDVVEALIGACFVAHGIDQARTLVHRLVDTRLDVAASLSQSLDWKTSLQELAAQRGYDAPEYTVTGSGPEHARQFTAQVAVGPTLGEGIGTAKKHAEQAAAENAFRELSAITGGDGSDTPDQAPKSAGHARLASEVGRDLR
jgi:ribonuclease-3